MAYRHCSEASSNACLLMERPRIQSFFRQDFSAVPVWSWSPREVLEGYWLCQNLNKQIIRQVGLCGSAWMNFPRQTAKSKSFLPGPFMWVPPEGVAQIWGGSSTSNSPTKERPPQVCPLGGWLMRDVVRLTISIGHCTCHLLPSLHKLCPHTLCDSDGMTSSCSRFLNIAGHMEVILLVSSKFPICCYFSV